MVSIARGALDHNSWPKPMRFELRKGIGQEDLHSLPKNTTTTITERKQSVYVKRPMCNQRKTEKCSGIKRRKATI